MLGLKDGRAGLCARNPGVGPVRSGFGVRPIFAAGLLVAGFATGALAGPGGVLHLEVVERGTKQPLACRMHLTNAAGKALKAPKVPFWHDHFVFDGTIALKLPK